MVLDDRIDANTMIETIQCLAEADPTRVLVALDFKTASQNVSRSAVQNSIEHTDPDLAAVFSRWYTGATECTSSPPKPRSVPSWPRSPSPVSHTSPLSQHSASTIASETLNPEAHFHLKILTPYFPP